VNQFDYAEAAHFPFKFGVEMKLTMHLFTRFIAVVAITLFSTLIFSGKAVAQSILNQGEIYSGAVMSSRMNATLDSLIITLEVFYDCPTAVFFPAIVAVKNNCVFATDAELPLLLDEEISDVCPGTFPICGLGGSVGERRVVYEGTVDLATFAACNPVTWRIYPEQRTNTDNLNNSPTSTSDRLRVNMDLYLANFPSNATPVFGSNGHPFICGGAVTKFDPQVTETEGDSLVFSFSQPLSGASAVSSNLIPYAAGFSLADPMGNGINIDSETGILDFTAPASGHYQIVIRVDEYDRATGTQKSTVFKDFQFQIDNACSNDGPTAAASITNVTNAALISNYEVTIDTGQAASFDFTFTGDIGEIVSLQSTTTSFLNGSSTSVSTVGNTTTMTINWTPSGADVGTHFITISAEDNACDVSGKGAQKIQVNVQETAVPVSIASVDLVPESCAGLDDGQITINKVGGTGPFGYYIVFFNGVSLDTITQTSNVFSNLAATNYNVYVVDSNDLSKDSVLSVIVLPGTNFILTNFSNILSACDTACNGQARAQTFGGANPKTYLWDDGTLLTNFQNSALCGGLRTVTVTEAGGCQAIDSVVIADAPAIYATVDSTFDASCNGANDGRAYFSPHGGYGPSTSTASYIIDQTQNVYEPYPFVYSGATVFTAANFTAFGTGFPGGDEGLTPTINLGFSFEFFGNSFSQIRVHSNGFVTFDIANPATTVNFNQTAIPNAAYPNNWIGLWEDLDLTAGGSVQTYSIGSGAQQAFVINFVDVPRFANNAQTETYQIVLYETSNIIQMFSESVIGTGMVQGIENGTGTSGFFVAGRNNATFTLTNDYLAFIPESQNFTYTWSSIGSGTSATNLTAGNYTVTITDARSCGDTVQFTIAEPTPLVIDTVITQPSCAGNADGAITASATGSNGGPFTFVWSTGATTATITNLTAGSYTVTATDVAGCTNTLTVILTDPVAVVASINLDNDVSCFGGADGQLTANGAGGSPGYTFLWSTGSTNQTISSLIAGNYTVTVTDINGCTDIASQVVSQPLTLVNVTVSSTGVSCIGGNDGTATANNATGGTPGYTYLWSTGATTQTINNLTAGTYIVTATDANGCTDTAHAVVLQPATAISVSINSVTDASCNGANDGGIICDIPVGGTPPYTFAWSDGSTSQNLSNIGSGTYTVTATDALGCTDTASAFVDEPALLVVDTTSTSQPTCAGSTNGSISVAATGGTLPYSFIWSTGATTDTISNLSAGTYIVTVTDNNSCQAIDSVIITEGVGVIADVSTFDPTCAGENSGSAIGGVIGGTGTLPFSYSWSTGATSQFLFGLTAGTYTLTVTDGVGCQDDTTFTLVDPTAVSVSMIDSINPSCANNDGSAEALATGGSGALTYAWSNGSTSALISALPAGTYIVTAADANGCSDSAAVVLEPAPTLTANGVLVANESCVTNDGSASVTVLGGTTPFTFAWTGGGTTQTISSLTAGTYVATVTDANNCSDTAQVIVADSCSCNWTASGVLVNDALCNGESSGAATTTNTGATAPIAYLWSNGSTNDSLINVPAGTYTVTLTDANGCTAVDTAIISEPAPIVLNGFTGITNPSCDDACDGAASVSVTGGTAPLTYAWSSGSTSAAATAICGGGHTVTVTDANGCDTVHMVALVEPPVIFAIVDSTDSASCNGAADGAAFLSGYGGTVAPTNTSEYVIDQTEGAFEPYPQGRPWNAHNYKLLTLADDATSDTVNIFGGSNFSFFGNNHSAFVISSQGFISFDLTLANQLNPGQFSNSLALPNNNASQPNNIIAAFWEDLDPSVGNATIETYLVGTAPNRIRVVNYIDVDHFFNGTTGSGDISTFQIVLYETSNIIQIHSEVLDPDLGNGGLHVQGIENATGTAAYTPPGRNNTNFSATNDYVAFIPKTQNFSYTWSSVGTGASSTVLPAGNYTVTVADGICNDVVNFTIDEPAPVLASITSSAAPTCFGGSDGQATVAAFGGDAPYTFLWTSGETTATAVGLSAGLNTVTVTDANGCTQTANTTLPNGAAINVGLTSTNSFCFVCTGTATATVSGALAPFTYSWSTGTVNTGVSTTNQITSLCSGPYGVTVTDANGCADSNTTSVSDNFVPNVTITSTPATCANTCDGTADANYTCFFGCQPYRWYSGLDTNNLIGTGDLITGLCPGTYLGRLTTNFGCDAYDTVIINAPAPLILNMDSVDATCGVANGLATVAVSGGVGPYTYAWSNGGTTDTISGLNAGTYTVTVTDNNLCTDTAQVTVNAPSSLVASIINPINALCDGSTDGSAEAQGTLGNAPYTFLWDNGETTAIALALDSGTHCVTVTDALGCTDTACIVIGDADPVTFTFTETPISCAGPGNDGAIVVASIGGTGAHTYVWNTGVTGNSITGLTTGTYTVTATDANGCQNSDSYFLNPPGNFTVAMVDSTDIDCNGNNNGSAEVQVVTGGSGSYSILWDNGSTTNIVNNLTPGLHSVTVTDLITSCVDSAEVTIDEPALLVATITSSVDNICFNGTDGSATANGSGGSAPYILTWSNGDTGPLADSLPAGMVTVTVTDANGCTDTDQIMIGQPATGLDASVTVNAQPLCTGDSATITASAVGGSGVYAFAWPTGETSTTVLLPAGSYCVTVTDGGVCEDTACVTIIDPLPVTATALVSLPTCPGGNDGSVTLTGAGGDGGPYSFLWDDGSTNATRSNLAAGTYAFTVTDASGCSGNGTVNVINPAGMSATFTNTTVSSCGTCNGTATVNITNGTAPYSFVWSSGSTNNNGNNLCSGINSVIVTDASGCIDTFFVNIGSIGADTVVASVVSNVNCNGGNDGSALATYVCNVAPCTIAWIDSASGAVVSNVDLATGLSAGTYYAQLTNDSGCVGLDTISITEPAPVVATTTFISGVSCPGGNDGSASVTSSGGTPGYTVLWDNGETTTTAISLDAGTHCVTITDALGCTDTACVNISQPANGVSVTASILTGLLCNGDNNGSVTAVGAGGTAPYTFIWNGAIVATTLNNLTAGTYIVEITDAGGCTALDTADLTEPAAITGTFSGIVDPLCVGASNGSATVTGGGGTGLYSYLWASGNTGQTETGLPEGIHCVDITDANGCTEQFCVTLTDPAPITNTFTGIANSSCTVCDGTATANPLPIAGAPYTFVWDNGQTTATNDSLCPGLNQVTITDANGCELIASIPINANGADLVVADSIDATCGNCDGEVFATYTCTSAPCIVEWTDLATGLIIGTADTISNLCEGSYIVELTNGAGCISSDIVSVNVPDLIDPNETITDASCFGSCDGAIALAPTGGSGVFTFNWSNGSTTSNITGLCAGSYTVTINDGAGCDSIATFTIDQLSEIVLDSTVLDASCSGICDGSIAITATGGAGGYSFNWSPTPGNGNGLSLASGLCAGTYFLTVTDANGCTTLDTFNIAQPAAIVQTSVTVTDATCGICDGAIAPVFAGGAGGFTFAWSNGATTPALSALCFGFYDVTVTDASGCFEVFGYPVSDVTGPAITLTSTNASASGVCDGTATVFAGGAGGYTFAWSNGDVTQTTTNLCAGFYTVTVTDVNGCNTVDTITITEPDLLDVSFDITEITCTGNGCDGEVLATATGGVPPYNYLWSNGATTEQITGLCSGTYVLTLTDNNGQVLIDSVTIIDPQPFNIISVSNDVSCPGECDGNISLNVTGGNPPYTILWNTGDTTLALADLCGGTYSVTITDTVGCSDSLTFIIDDPAPIIGNVVSQNNPDCQVNNGSITVSASGGNGGPYTYEWLDALGNPLVPAQTDSVANNLFAGIYAVRIVDANGCVDTTGIILNNANAPIIDLDLLVDVSCFGECDGAINTTISGGVAPYNILWSNGETTDDIDSLCAGDDTIAVIDDNLCAVFNIYTISQPTEIIVNSVDITDVTCGADCDGVIDISISGGTAPYSFAWSNGGTDSNLSGLCAGDYTLTVTDANGCTFITTETVDGPAPLVIIVDSIRNATCTNTGDGLVQITVTGGSAPYSNAWISGSTTILTTSDLNGVEAGDYILIVTDANGCSLTDTFTIEAEFFVEVIAMEDIEVCPFTNQLSVTGTNTGATSTRWLRPNGAVVGTGSSIETNTTSQTTTFIYEGINNVCVDRDTVNITWSPGPGVDAGPDKTIVPGDITTIGGSPTANSGVDVIWGPAQDLTSITEYNPQANPLETITYYVSATDADGCFGIDSVTVTVEELVDPVGGFSPNGDGVNDFFLIDRISDYPDAIVQIFNRWGNLIYESAPGYTNPWNGKHNGKELTVGTYYYVIDLKDDQVKNLITGPVTILK